MDQLPQTYFELYDMDATFFPNRAEVKRKFYELSRKYHPDFHTMADDEVKDMVENISTMNNDAFKVLSDPHETMKYILEEHEMIGEGIKNEMPQSFLMEMMEINESMMEVSMDPDPHAKDEIKQEVNEMIDRLLEEVRPVLETYGKEGSSSGNILRAAKEYYLKKQYMLRILKNLDNFAEP